MSAPAVSKEVAPPRLPEGGGGGRWLAELALGARMALAGGREGRLRVALTALGVGLGAALLLLAASVPAAWEARQDRMAGIGVEWGGQAAASERAVRVYAHDLDFRDQRLRGLRVQPEGMDPATPLGVTTLPGPGELVVSPALARLLESPDGALLRPRLDYPIVGIIGDDGLLHPQELAFYLGDNTLTADAGDRIGEFGLLSHTRQPLPRALVALLAVGLVVLLLPVALFVAVAVRFGGESRDRRLAALRLAGADSTMTRRVAAGEASVAALLGLLAGAAFFLAGRQLAERMVLYDVSVFAAELRPSLPLLLVILAGVPALAVGVTMLAMRSLVVEPLGVVRRARTPRRRLWWRLLFPTAGVAVLIPMWGSDLAVATDPYIVAAGVGLLLLGVASLLPWLIDAMVRRQRGAGPTSWQLAMRRLQLSGGSVGRIVNGTAVAAAGAIALQMVFSSVAEDFTTSPPVEIDPALAVAGIGQVEPHDLDRTVDAVHRRFADTAGVRGVAAVSMDGALVDGDIDQFVTVGVADCAAWRELVDVHQCTDGDVFVRARSDLSVAENGPGLAGAAPGAELWFGEPEEATRWRLPEGAEAVTVPADPYRMWPDVLVTPGAGAPLHMPYLRVNLRLDHTDPDAIEHARNTAAGIDISLRVSQPRPPTDGAVEEFNTVRTGLLIGVTITLVVIGMSLLVSTVEQLRERRRMLAVLVAFGARRRTLAWSVLWQTMVPVLLGLGLATVVGLGTGMLLTRILTDRPVVIDVATVGVVAGIAAAVMLLVTALAMPVLWRLMRPGGLRTE